MKKIFIFVIGLAVTLTFSSCKYYKELIVLNWQDYISYDVIKAFEEENDCIVTELAVTSNEQMYADILNRKVPYDIAIPSDYMIDKLYKADLLQEIDKTRLENYNENMFVPELQELMNRDGNNNYIDYYIPYFWGSLGIMYSKKNYPNIGEIIEEHGFSVFFEDNLLPAGAKVAMYDSSRDSLAAAELYLGYSLNTTNEQEIKSAFDLIKNRRFKNWGTDNLKIEVAAGNIDCALVYSGDYFDAYYSDVEGTNPENVNNYGIYAPTKANNVFYDGMVIPITSAETELAYKFIDFFLDYDNSFTNTDAVGYCPTLKDVYNDIFSSPDYEDLVAIEAYNPALVVNEAQDKAEVYLDLGTETYKIIEKYYIDVRYI